MALTNRDGGLASLIPGTVVLAQYHGGSVDDETRLAMAQALNRLLCHIGADASRSFQICNVLLYFSFLACSSDGSAWEGCLLLVPISPSVVTSSSARRALLQGDVSGGPCK